MIQKVLTKETLDEMGDDKLRSTYEQVMGAEPASSIARDRLVASILEAVSEEREVKQAKQETIKRGETMSKSSKAKRGVKSKKANHKGILADTGVKKAPRKCKCGKPTKTPRSHWCAICYRARRKKQLADNNKTLAANIKAGKAKHYAIYNGKPTAWALANKQAAIALAKKRAKSPLERTAKLAEVTLKVLAKAKAA